MKKIFFITCMVLLSCFVGHGQIAAWNFYGQTAPVTFPATTFHVNLVNSEGSSNITRGPGAPASGGIHSFRTTGFQNNGISTTNTDYFQITLQAAPGYKISLFTLDAKFNGTTTFFASPGVTFQFAYSLNGVDFILIGNPVQSTSLTMAQIDLAGIPDLQNVFSVTTITLRYYASGQTTTGGWGFYSATSGTNGLAVGGSVTDAPVSTPTMQASEIAFCNVQQTQMTVSWTSGNGGKRVVKINTSNSFTDPADGTDPTANPVYAGAGEQVVYNYSGSTIPQVSGLTTGVTYWFRVYEYNGAGTLTMFNTNTGTNNPGNQTASTILLAPSICSPTATLITPVSAVLGGHITSDGGSGITSRGTVWSPTSPVTFSDHNLPGSGTDTGFFTHQRDSLPSGEQIFYAAYAMNTTGITLTEESTFFTLSTEPSSHVTDFAATSAGTTSIDLTWIPPMTGTDGYLILQNQGAGISNGMPSDATQYLPGTTIGNGVVAANITQGATGMATISGLSPGTTYAFSIFPYTWDGANPQTSNYLTLLPLPGAVATTDVPAVATFHWTGALGNDWNTAGNWDPARTIPALNDILIFDCGETWNIANIPAQTIGQMHVLAVTAITLNGAGTLTVAGDTGEDLLVDAGCQLNLSGPGAISISIPGGATGMVSGSMTFSGSGHRLLAASANGITFSTGGMFKTGSGFTGNPFGVTNLNSVVFAQGSVYACQAGGNPFGASAPAAVAVFQPGSLYRIDAYNVPSFGGRTYGNFEMNYAGAITATGSSAVSIDNFTASQGTFYFNVTGSPGHSIKGNIFVANVATLIFAPSAAGKVLLNGTLPQTISGSGSVMAGPWSTLAVSNSAGVTLNMNATLHNITISAGGLFTIGPEAELTVNGDLVNEAAASGLILEPESSMIHDNAGVSGTVKRNIASASWFDRQDGWHFLSSPVAGQTIDSAGGFITTGAGNDFDFFAWSEPDNIWVNIKNTASPPYFSDINGSNDFETGRGYLAAYEQTANKLFSGVLNVADVPVENLTITGTDAPTRGWHLLGNPFSCALRWYDGWSASNLSGVAQIWNEEGRSYSPCNPGDVIPACNGFMVQVAGSEGNSGSLTIPAANRVHDSQPWYKESEYPVLKLLARNIGLPSFQETQIRFNPSSTNDFDPEFDGRFLPGYAPHFYSVCGEEKLAVNSIPALSNDISIPFSFEKDVGTQFRIEALFIDDIPAMVLLADRKLGFSHNLSLDPVYWFTADDGDAPDRFEVSINHVGIDKPPGKESKVTWCGNNILIDHQENTRIEIFAISGKRILVQDYTGTGSEKVILNVPVGWYLLRVATRMNLELTKVFIRSSYQ